MDKSILLVDDNPDDVELTVRAFRSTDVQDAIRIARDGRDAIDQLFGSHTRPLPSLVLLDLKLPGLDGIDVLRRIRADPLTRALPVVILTSSNERVDLMNCYRLGANSYVRKPVSFSDFLAVTSQLASYWLSLNESL
jgi:two-component system response regulator